jgi:DNA helicase-4
VLAREAKEDFSGLLERACGAIEQGRSGFARRSGAGEFSQMQYVLVDEFQDYSPLFDRLIAAISNRSPAIKVFCVGDD